MTIILDRAKEFGLFLTGYKDRFDGLPPSVGRGDAYWRGYCDRIRREIATDTRTEKGDKDMIRGNETICGQRIRCYDLGDETCDRYTVVYMDQREFRPGTFACVGMSGAPFHPQGIGQHSAAMIGGHLGRRIHFADLPDDCQRVVKHDLTSA